MVLKQPAHAIACINICVHIIIPSIDSPITVWTLQLVQKRQHTVVNPQRWNLAIEVAGKLEKKMLTCAIRLLQIGVLPPQKEECRKRRKRYHIPQDQFVQFCCSCYNFSCIFFFCRRNGGVLQPSASCSAQGLQRWRWFRCVSVVLRLAGLGM